MADGLPPRRGDRDPENARAAHGSLLNRVMSSAGGDPGPGEHAALGRCSSRNCRLGPGRAPLAPGVVAIPSKDLERVVWWLWFVDPPRRALRDEEERDQFQVGIPFVPHDV